MKGVEEKGRITGIGDVKQRKKKRWSRMRRRKHRK
jgi:hypothetical protein